MRLFVAVRPPDEVLDQLDALPRPEVPGVRWSRRDQWHVTLRFFGEVDQPDEALSVLLTSLAGEPAAEVTVGPAVRPLGSRVVVVPVAGLDAMATTIVDATRHIGKPPPARTFAGHLTLARLKHPTVRCPIVGSSLAARWTAIEVELIRSHLSNVVSRYETLAVIPTDQRNATRDSPSC